jgi:hypothetical protein
LGTYSGSSISDPAIAPPGLFLDNIHKRINQPSIWAKPNPFVGIQGTRGRRDGDFESPPPLDADWIIGRTTKRDSVVGKLKMPDKPIFMGGSVADDIESVSSM